MTMETKPRLPVVLTIFILVVLLNVTATLAQTPQGDVLFFCSGSPICLHWNDLASGKLLGRVATPVGIPFVNNQHAVVNSASKMYHYFWNNDNQTSGRIFTYSYKDSSLPLLGSCGFDLEPFWYTMCAVIDEQTNLVYMITYTLASGPAQIRFTQINPQTCGQKVISQVEIPLDASGNFQHCVYSFNNQKKRGSVVFFNNKIVAHRATLRSIDTATGSLTTLTIFPYNIAFRSQIYLLAATPLEEDSQAIYYWGYRSTNNSAYALSPSTAQAFKLFDNGDFPGALVGYPPGLLSLNWATPSSLLSPTGKRLWLGPSGLEGAQNCAVIGGLVFSPR